MENKNNYSFVEMGTLCNVKEKESFGIPGKYFLKDELGLTSCEISFGAIPAGQAVPFLHAHKENEEIYIFLQGSGIFYVDGQNLSVKEGSMIKVSPEGKRGLKAEEDLLYICVQAKENSLKQAVPGDGLILEEKLPW